MIKIDPTRNPHYQKCAEMVGGVARTLFREGVAEKTINALLPLSREGTTTADISALAADMRQWFKESAADIALIAFRDGLAQRVYQAKAGSPYSKADPIGIEFLIASAWCGATFLAMRCVISAAGKKEIERRVMEDMTASCGEEKLNELAGSLFAGSQEPVFGQYISATDMLAGMAAGNYFSVSFGAADEIDQRSVERGAEIRRILDCPEGREALWVAERVGDECVTRETLFSAEELRLYGNDDAVVMPLLFMARSIFSMYFALAILEDPHTDAADEILELCRDAKNYMLPKAASRAKELREHHGDFVYTVTNEPPLAGSAGDALTRFYFGGSTRIGRKETI